MHLAMRDGSGDRLAALLTDAPGKKPLIVLIHGLTGCETSMNMVRSALHYHALGFPVLRLNLRGAGPSRETCRGDYHAGCSRDLADALGSLVEMAPELTANGLFLSAVSLGANVMIKFLAEYGVDFPIRAVVSTSAPIDLAASSLSVMRPRNALYHHWLLKRMKVDCRGSALEPMERATLEEVRPSLSLMIVSWRPDTVSRGRCIIIRNAPRGVFSIRLKHRRSWSMHGTTHGFPRRLIWPEIGPAIQT
jgi:predicted alpha/beta-fold hydrolase